jgi:hypothetical protein
MGNVGAIYPLFRSTDRYSSKISFLLVRYPEALSKLRKQITSVIPKGQEITRAHIARILFLKCVINESEFLLHSLSVSAALLTYISALHLYPQIPINVRFALKTTILPSGGGPDGKSPMASPRSSCAKGQAVPGQPTTCIAWLPCMAMMRTNSLLSAGRTPI